LRRTWYSGMGEIGRGPKTLAVLLALLASGCAVTTRDAAQRAPVEDRTVVSRPGTLTRPEPTTPATSVSRPPALPPVAAPVPLPESVEIRPMPPPGQPAESGPGPAPPATPPIPQPPPTADRGLPRPPPPRSPAAAVLLNQASQQARAGELEQASATLERALRIEPDNPWIWHQLGLVRLFQRQDEQAAQLAARSNALTSDAGLQARNWRLIAQSKERLGETDDARSAAARARALGKE